MIPGKSDPRWRALVTGGQGFQFSFLPLKICMSRIKIELSRGVTEAKIERSIDMVRELLTKYESLAAADIKKIFPPRSS